MRSELRAAALIGALVAAAAAPDTAAGTGTDDIAVIVHAGVPEQALTLAELRKLYLGDRQFWPSGGPVTLVVPTPALPERAVLLNKVYRMTESQFKQYWIAKVFRAEAVASPKTAPSTAVALQLVDLLPGALAVVRASDVPKGYKRLRIDGLAPGEPGYPLGR